MRSDVEVKGNAAVRIEADARVDGTVKGTKSRQVLVLNTQIIGNIQTDGTAPWPCGTGALSAGNIQLKQRGTARIENTTVRLVVESGRTAW